MAKSGRRASRRRCADNKVSAAGVIRGRTVTTVAKCALDAEQGGAKYVDQAVVKDGNIISCRTWHDYSPFFHEFMKMLNARR